MFGSAKTHIESRQLAAKLATPTSAPLPPETRVWRSETDAFWQWSVAMSWYREHSEGFRNARWSAETAKTA
jgi:hypothetical protein